MGALGRWHSFGYASRNHREAPITKRHRGPRIQEAHRCVVEFLSSYSTQRLLLPLWCLLTAGSRSPSQATGIEAKLQISYCKPGQYADPLRKHCNHMTPMGSKCE